MGRGEGIWLKAKEQKQTKRWGDDKRMGEKKAKWAFEGRNLEGRKEKVQRREREGNNKPAQLKCQRSEGEGGRWPGIIVF
jgi:hypothetical protein